MRRLLCVVLLTATGCAAYESQVQCDPESNKKPDLAPLPWPQTYGAWGSPTFCDPTSLGEGEKKSKNSPNWMWNTPQSECFKGGYISGKACPCTTVRSSNGVGCGCIMANHESLDIPWCFRGGALTCADCPIGDDKVGKYRAGCGCDVPVADTFTAAGCSAGTCVVTPPGYY